MAILVGLLAAVSTFLGGAFAIKLKDKLHLILGFSAGAVLGVAFFDLLPESLKLASDSFGISKVILLMAIGFMLYLVADRFFSLHCHDCENPSHQHTLGSFGASTLIVHSFLDGLGIGLAFMASPAIGWIVAAAVLAHDFSDGINTVSMILKNSDGRRSTIYWLVADALAPLVGIIVANFIQITRSELGLILAVFTGFFFYLGASDLVPESHHRHPTAYTTIMTLLGMVLIYIVVSLAP